MCNIYIYAYLYIRIYIQCSHFLSTHPVMLIAVRQRMCTYVVSVCISLSLYIYIYIYNIKLLIHVCLFVGVCRYLHASVCMYAYILSVSVSRSLSIYICIYLHIDTQTDSQADRQAGRQAGGPCETAVFLCPREAVKPELTKLIASLAKQLPTRLNAW